jgi:hypothetical protein
VCSYGTGGRGAMARGGDGGGTTPLFNIADLPPQMADLAQLLNRPPPAAPGTAFSTTVGALPWRNAAANQCAGGGGRALPHTEEAAPLARSAPHPTCVRRRVRRTSDRRFIDTAPCE